jgi:hypothetical protein
MLMEIMRKIALIGAGSPQSVYWQQRTEAFRTWQRLANERNAALLAPDVERQRRLCMLSDIAWQHYMRLFDLAIAPMAR